MATTVGTIITNAKALALSTLGSPWQEMIYAFDLRKNDSRAGKKAYTVVPLEAVTADTVTHYYALDQRFQLILSDVLARQGSDAEIFTVLSDLYDKADEIFKAYSNNKLNLPTTILLVTQPSLSVPEMVGDLVALRMNFLVKYRQALT